MDGAAEPARRAEHPASSDAASACARDSQGDADESLIRQALGGDSLALRRVWEQHRRWVAAIILAHKPRETDLEDLLQDVAVMLVSKYGDVRDAAAFKPWLRAVAVSIARTRGRRQRVQRDGWLRLVGWAGSGARDDRETRSTNKEAARLMELAQRIPDQYREPLLLKAVQGMSYREIGRVMSLPETTVETRIARGRRMLRELSEREGLDGATKVSSPGELASAGRDRDG
jgi:RNA polymerase sigma-70 factor (ECF subfamily)